TVPNVSYSFDVPANSNFVVVVNTNTAGTTCTQFSGLVSGFFDLTPGPGACETCTPPATPTISTGGDPTTFCSGGSVTLTSSSGTSYQWYRNSVLLGGQTNQ